MKDWQKKSQFILSILEEDNPIETLLHLIEHPEHDVEAVFELKEMRDRRAIRPLLEAAKRKGDGRNGLYLYALTAFNCEEYITEILDLGMNGSFEARIHIYSILLDTEALSSKIKNKALDDLLDKREELLLDDTINEERLEFIKECLEAILEIPLDTQVKKAVVLPLKKKAA